MVSTAILPGSIASGVATEFNNVQRVVSDFNFPQRIGVIAQPNAAATGFVSNERRTITTSQEAGQIFGFGSPIHMISRVLYNQSLNVGSIPVDVYPVPEAVGATEALGSLSFVGVQTETQGYVLTISSVQIGFTLTTGATATEAATLVKKLVDQNINLPVVAGPIVLDAFDLKSNWNGLNANDISIKLDGTEAGITFVVTPLAGGTLTADVTDALANVGEVWDTVLINQFNDTLNLNIINARGEELWLPTVSQPFYSFYGSVETDPATVIIDTELRKNERINAKFPVPGSNSIEFEIAASVAAYVAITADNNAAQPYVGGVIYGILPGSFAQQWDYQQRDEIEKGGCSTSYTNGGSVVIGDVLTTYHPDGLDNPGYRYVVDVVKLQFIAGDIKFTFTGEDWQGVILINEDDNSSNPKARKPSSATAAMHGIIGEWGGLSIIVNVPEAKANSFAARSLTNPSRLDLVYNIFLSGAGRIFANTVNYTIDTGA